MSGTPPSSPDLLEGVRLAQKAGSSREASRQLLERVVVPVRRTVMRLAGSAEPDDFVSDSLAAILRSSGSYKGQGSLEAWSSAVAFRVTMRGLKRLRRRERTTPADVRLEQRFADEPRAEHAGQLADRLQQHLLRLPSDQAEALVLRVVMGYRVDEVAELTKVSSHTVRGRIRAALSRLRRSAGKDPALLELAGRHDVEP